MKTNFTSVLVLLDDQHSGTVAPFRVGVQSTMQHEQDVCE